MPTHNKAIETAKARLMSAFEREYTRMQIEKERRENEKRRAEMMLDHATSELKEMEAEYLAMFGRRIEDMHTVNDYDNALVVDAVDENGLTAKWAKPIKV